MDGDRQQFHAAVAERARGGEIVSGSEPQALTNKQIEYLCEEVASLLGALLHSPKVRRVDAGDDLKAYRVGSNLIRIDIKMDGSSGT